MFVIKELFAVRYCSLVTWAVI